MPALGPEIVELSGHDYRYKAVICCTVTSSSYFSLSLYSY